MRFEHKEYIGATISMPARNLPEAARMADNIGLAYRVTCPECGKTLHFGDWPWCPHGIGLHSFSLRGAGFHCNDYPRKETNETNETKSCGVQ